MSEVPSATKGDVLDRYPLLDDRCSGREGQRGGRCGDRARFTLARCVAHLPRCDVDRHGQRVEPTTCRDDERGRRCRGAGESGQKNDKECAQSPHRGARIVRRAESPCGDPARTSASPLAALSALARLAWCRRASAQHLQRSAQGSAQRRPAAGILDEPKFLRAEEDGVLQLRQAAGTGLPLRTV